MTTTPNTEQMTLEDAARKAIAGYDARVITPGIYVYPDCKAWYTSLRSALARREESLMQADQTEREVASNIEKLGCFIPMESVGGRDPECVDASRLQRVQGHVGLWGMLDYIPPIVNNASALLATLARQRERIVEYERLNGLLRRERDGLADQLGARQARLARLEQEGDVARTELANEQRNVARLQGNWNVAKQNNDAMRIRIEVLEAEKLSDAARGEEIIAAREGRISFLEIDNDSLHREVTALEAEITRLRTAGPVGMTRERLVSVLIENGGLSLDWAERSASRILAAFPAPSPPPATPSPEDTAAVERFCETPWASGLYSNRCTGPEYLNGLHMMESDGLIIARLARKALGMGKHCTGEECLVDTGEALFLAQQQLATAEARLDRAKRVIETQKSEWVWRQNASIKKKVSDDAAEIALEAKSEWKRAEAEHGAKLKAKAQAEFDFSTDTALAEPKPEEEKDNA